MWVRYREASLRIHCKILWNCTDENLWMPRKHWVCCIKVFHHHNLLMKSSSTTCLWLLRPWSLVEQEFVLDTTWRPGGPPTEHAVNTDIDNILDFYSFAILCVFNVNIRNLQRLERWIIIAQTFVKHLCSARKLSAPMLDQNTFRCKLRWGRLRLRFNATNRSSAPDSYLWLFILVLETGSRSSVNQYRGLYHVEVMTGNWRKVNSVFISSQGYSVDKAVSQSINGSANNKRAMYLTDQCSLRLSKNFDSF